MRRVMLCLGIVFFVLLKGAVPAQAENKPWTFVFGTLKDSRLQAEYEKDVQDTCKYYQDAFKLEKTLIVREKDFTYDLTQGTVMFLGPITAFKNLSVLGLPLKIQTPEKVKIGDMVFDDPSMGIYLANPQGDRLLYSGLSYHGYQDIFRVSTGDTSFLGTIEGSSYCFGNYVGKNLVVQSFHFSAKYPSRAEVEDLELPKNAFPIKPLEGKNPFSWDLDWLKEKVAGQRVFFFGESHWAENIHFLVQRMIIYLTKHARLGAVFLELPYSYSGFYTYYVTIEEDRLAEKFFAEYLDFLVGDEAIEVLLRTLRKRNLEHSGPPVLIGCNDMEWAYGYTLRNIVTPYFKRLDPGFVVKTPESQDECTRVIRMLREKLKEAKKNRVVGDYPFITPELMETIIQSLEDTFVCNYSGEKWSELRQKAFIRNTTDPRYNGRAFDTPLVFIHGGGWHANKNATQAKDDMPEATYLNHFFPKTKGKVYSLLVDYLALNFQPVAEINFATHFPSGTPYNNLVLEFHKFRAMKKANLTDFYMVWSGAANIFHHLLVKVGYENSSNIFRFGSIQWAALEKSFGEEMSKVRDRYNIYDDVIYVLKSPIQKTRKRPGILSSDLPKEIMASLEELPGTSKRSPPGKIPGMMQPPLDRYR